MRVRLMARILQLGALAWIAFWACGPPTQVPPPIPFAAHQPHETAVYGVGSAPLGDYRPNTPERDWPIVPDMGVVHTRPGSTGWTRGIEGWVGTSTTASLGVSFRRDWTRRDDRYAGVHLAVGGLYGSVGVPLATQVGPRTWVYTQPTLSVTVTGPGHLPAGVSWQATPRLRLDVNAGVSNAYLRRPFVTELGHYSEPIPRVWGSVGVAVRPSR